MQTLAESGQRLARLLQRACVAYRRNPEAFVRKAAARLMRVGAPDGERHVIDALPNIAPVNFEIVRALGEPYLNVMVPGMVMRAMSGGPNTILNLTYRLAREGVPVRYVSTDIPPDGGDAMWTHLRSVTGIEQPLQHVQIVSGRDPSSATRIGRDDVFMGTAWWTVHMLSDALPRSRHSRFLYLIQDFEPGFYPWSTVHALALETYGLHFLAIVNEPLLLEHLVQSGVGRFREPGFAQTCVTFDPAIDRTRFHQRERSNDADGPRRLLFYARPNTPRNLYELGLVALKRAADRGAFASGRWELFFMGEEGISPARLTSDVLVRPHEWLNYDEYGRLLRGSDVGLALMLSPHTGYPALEMAACGLRTITNTYSVKTAERLRMLSEHRGG